MGYELNAQGVIAIDPPLTWGQIRDSKYLPNFDGRGRESDLMFVITGTVTNTEEGVLTIRTATGVKQRWDDEPRNRNIEAELQELVDTYPGHQFLGRFDLEGEEAGDLCRLKVVNGKATTFEPTLTWPEESE